VSPSAVTMSRFMRTAIIITAVLIVIGLTLVAFVGSGHGRRSRGETSRRGGSPGRAGSDKMCRTRVQTAAAALPTRIRSRFCAGGMCSVGTDRTTWWRVPMTPTLPFRPERSSQDGSARGDGCFSIPPTSGMGLTGICMWQRPMALSGGRGLRSAANRSHPAPPRMPLPIEGEKCRMLHNR
jgi:hypothetical protein